MKVFVDARMAGHSGIGVVLEMVLREWTLSPPPFDLVLMGGGASIAALFKESTGEWTQRVRMVPWTDRIYSPLAAAKSLTAFGATRGDVFFSPHYATSLVAGVPLVCFIQDAIHWTHPPRAGTSAYSRAYFAALARRAAYVLAPSRHVKVQLQTLLGFEPHRVLRVPLGPGCLDGIAQNAPAPPMQDAYFLSLGLYKAHKNWDFALARFAALWKADELAPRLLAGGLGPAGARARFHATLTRLGIANRVEVLEHLPAAQLAQVYAGARALVFPSLAEGFGLPILEAQRLGAPVLIADREPMTEVAGGAALLFDPDCPETFDDGLVRLATDDVLRAQLRESGAANAARYSWSRTASHIAEVLMRAARE